MKIRAKIEDALLATANFLSKQLRGEISDYVRQIQGAKAYNESYLYEAKFNI